jgi:hypothetical protein
MSRGKTPEIFEITSPREMLNVPNQQITCRGVAEWSEGDGAIEYGAHVSEGGALMLSYQQL